MTTTFTVIVLVLAAVMVLLAVLGAISRRGAPPGPTDGRLAPCPTTPNCVSSEAPPDSGAYLAPLELPPGGPAQAMTLLEDMVRDMGGKVRTVKDGYLAAEFSSRLFGFVDDLELRVGDGVVHVRSASRVGYSDGGVNRSRVAELKRRYAQWLLERGAV